MISDREIPYNTLSCFIARICASPDDTFIENGILIVDPYWTDDEHTSNEKGKTQRAAHASWTLRAAYTAWSVPPIITYKGNMKLKGKVVLPNAKLSSVSISGGPPLQGPVTTAAGPGTATIPVNISNATGSAKIEQNGNAELELSTDDKFDVSLSAQYGSVLPWCVSPKNPSEKDSPDEEAEFISAGDLALCIAIGNSIDNLYVVDIIKQEHL